MSRNAHARHAVRRRTTLQTTSPTRATCAAIITIQCQSAWRGDIEAMWERQINPTVGHEHTEHRWREAFDPKRT